MNDQDIIDLYFARDEQAIAETDKSYGKVCMQVSMNILDSRPDAEECVSDTYLKTWNSIPPTKPRSLCAFVCRIARNLSINRLRELYPQANITPIDYDPSATQVNQENRIKLMLSVGREALGT